MSRSLICLLMAFALTSPVDACSLIASPALKMRTSLNNKPTPPPKLKLMAVHFLPRIADAGSCDGTGMMSVELRVHGRRTRGIGFLLKETGGNPRAIVPDHALAAYTVKDGVATVSWAWPWADTDPDGQMLWRFTVQTINAAGEVGEPVAVCASSNDACASLK